MGKGNILRLSDARSQTPPISAGIAAGLCADAVDAIQQADVKDIIGAVVAKAKSGDVTAAKFVLDFLGTQAKAAQTPLVIQPDKVGQARRAILEHVAAKGVRKVPALAEELGLSRTLVMEAVEHEWFESQSGGIHLSSDGWAEVRAAATG